MPSSIRPRTHGSAHVPLGDGDDETTVGATSAGVWQPCRGARRAWPARPPRAAVSNRTLPISLRYMRTGSLLVLPSPDRSSSGINLFLVLPRSRPPRPLRPLALGAWVSSLRGPRCRGHGRGSKCRRSARGPSRLDVLQHVVDVLGAQVALLAALTTNSRTSSRSSRADSPERTFFQISHCLCPTPCACVALPLALAYTILAMPKNEKRAPRTPRSPSRSRVAPGGGTLTVQKGWTVLQIYSLAALDTSSEQPYYHAASV